MIPFAEWTPDLADLGNPGATVAKNVLPHRMGYAPLNAVSAYSSALDARCSGAIYTTDKDGNVYTYAGSAAKIELLSNSGWSDKTNAGGAYTLTSTEYWEFAKWGNDIIAVGGLGEAVQTITLGGAAFADLGGSPPNSKHIAVARNFVILGNIYTGAANVPNRVQWSGVNDATTWTAAAATQADSEDVKTGGAVQRLFGGEYGVVMLETSIYRMSYVGAPVVWAFDEVSPNVGLVAPGMAAQAGDVIYFLSPKGFFTLTNGSQLSPIGANRVDEFVLNDLDKDKLDRCSAVVDNATHRVFFAYPGNGSTGSANKMVIYDPTLDRWSYSEQDTQVLLISATAGYTLETLDNYNSSIDAITISLDDDAWTGGRAQLGKLDSDNKLGFFTGNPMTATIETGELQMTPDRRTLLSAIRPVVDGGSQTIQVGYRNLQTATEAWTTARTPTANGRANVRLNARYHRVRANLTGTWTHAQGVEAEASAAGWR